MQPGPDQSHRFAPPLPVDRLYDDPGMAEENEEEEERHTPNVSRQNIRPPISSPEDMPALRIYHPGGRSRDQDYI